MKNIPLYEQILIAMLLGLLWTFISEELGLLQFNINWLAPFGDIFMRLLKFIAVPLVLFSIIKVPPSPTAKRADASATDGDPTEDLTSLDGLGTSISASESDLKNRIGNSHFSAIPCAEECANYAEIVNVVGAVIITTLWPIGLFGDE